jgi:hypothetical protein
VGWRKVASFEDFHEKYIMLMGKGRYPMMFYLHCNMKLMRVFPNRSQPMVFSPVSILKVREREE